MNNTLCFVIEKKKIYLEQVLVEYMGVPIFFLCHDGTQMYLALCSDIYELEYIIVRISSRDVFDLLHGNISMRDAFLKQNEYWHVLSGDVPEDDVVNKFSISDLDNKILPDENAYFEILTQDVKKYTDEFDEKFWSEKYSRIAWTQTRKLNCEVYKRHYTIYNDNGMSLQRACCTQLEKLNKRPLNHKWLVDNDDNVYVA